MGFLNSIKKLFGFGSDETVQNQEFSNEFAAPVVETVEEPKIEKVEIVEEKQPELVEIKPEVVEIKVEESHQTTVAEIKSESKFKQKTEEGQEKKKPNRRPRPKKKKTEE